jgi:hypothetical protein
LIGGALASIAAVGAIAGGLVGYWNVWKTIATRIFKRPRLDSVRSLFNGGTNIALNC